MSLRRRIESLEDNTPTPPIGNPTIWDVILGEAEPDELSDSDRVEYECLCLTYDEPCPVEAAIDAVGHLESSK